MTAKKMLKNKIVFQIAGIVLKNNRTFSMKEGVLEFGTTLPSKKKNLLSDIKNKTHYYSQEDLLDGIVCLLNDEIPYVISESNDSNDVNGYHMYFKTKTGELAARHFNLLNKNTILRNILIFFFQEMEDFIQQTIRTETKYGFKVNRKALLSNLHPQEQKLVV